MKNIMTIIKT